MLLLSPFIVEELEGQEKLNNSPQSYLFNKKHDWDRDSEPRLFISTWSVIYPQNAQKKFQKIDKYKKEVWIM